MRFILIFAACCLSMGWAFCETPTAPCLEFKNDAGAVVTVKIGPHDTVWDEAHQELTIRFETAKKCPGYPANQNSLRLLHGSKCYLEASIYYTISSAEVVGGSVAVVDLRESEIRVQFGTGFPLTMPYTPSSQNRKLLAEWIKVLAENRPAATAP